MAMRDILSAYEGAWSEVDAARRNAILRRTLDKKFIYCDPLICTEGHDQLSGYIGELQRTVPMVRLAAKPTATVS